MSANDPAAAQVARAYHVILSWGCPECGRPYPCEHDLAENKTPMTGNLGGATVTGAHEQSHEGSTHESA
jgi:hypothetical protein